MSDYVAPPVIVSYFDPRTGKPSPVKCAPLHPGGKPRKASADIGMFKSQRRPRRAVEVDGKRFALAKDAAEFIGCAPSTLNRALAKGIKCKGREVRRAE